ncbi:MAG TPA: cytochrome C oxidase subunit IV family protein [Flavisolibacter sp.]|nr:cytochrome C oxidase subunit IV family protein [Flavisolibacter sp.]
MEHPAFPEVTEHHEPSGSTKRIWRTFWILTIVTIIELMLGLLIYAFEGMPSWLVMALKGVICILTLVKAFYIVAVFMHLGDEIKNMVMTVVTPLVLFVWFITAFLWDGSSFRALRNRYQEMPQVERMQQPVKAADTATHPLN